MKKILFVLAVFLLSCSDNRKPTYEEKLRLQEENEQKVVESLTKKHKAALWTECKIYSTYAFKYLPQGQLLVFKSYMYNIIEKDNRIFLICPFAENNRSIYYVGIASLEISANTALDLKSLTYYTFVFKYKSAALFDNSGLETEIHGELIDYVCLNEGVDM